MRKIVFLTAFVVLGIAGVSCSSDDYEQVNVHEKGFRNNGSTGAVFSREGDTINMIDTLQITPQVGGPGDDPIIVPPPPPRP
ncbi:hypothetical protein [Flavobacterium suncheonense]|uniref:Lipoprotein n=1 Tax=Flavobacterium suncheonense GH29-5 = DSM 17707 TaxID=1121899 RepID=A0A0A2MG19_9FLAO|nr:hypothetical protein [Flavobacterium suncheonense]KGO90551.1 hypothetical protein Q764_00045 [Flavobacterium suncheonense GH29-5 = DSM 17707]